MARGRPRYRIAYAKAQAMAAQWRLVPPLDPDVPGQPPALPWMTPPVGGLGYIAFEPVGTRVEPNEFAAEQFLANELTRYEPPDSGGITTARL